MPVVFDQYSKTIKALVLAGCEEQREINLEEKESMSKETRKGSVDCKTRVLKCLEGKTVRSF